MNKYTSRHMEKKKKAYQRNEIKVWLLMKCLTNATYNKVCCNFLLKNNL